MWQGKEKKLHECMSGNPTPENLRAALRYFQVARNFKGLKQDSNANRILRALHDVRTSNILSPEQQVVELAKQFKKDGFQNNVSAASKLLWLSARQPYIIFDSRSASALSEMDSCKYSKADYPKFCAAWKRAYATYEPKIQHAVEQLPRVREFMPNWNISDKTLLSIASKPWFKERVFDIHLWELGGDG